MILPPENSSIRSLLHTRATAKVKLHIFAGQTLLVLGAAGGVGVAACQIGKALGAKVR